MVSMFHPSVRREDKVYEDRGPRTRSDERVWDITFCELSVSSLVGGRGLPGETHVLSRQWNLSVTIFTSLLFQR